MKISHRLLIITILSIIAFGLVYPFAPIAAAPKAGLCILIVIAGLWNSEALPVAITALLIPILAALFHLETLTGSLAHFASPVVFLIFGGFILSAVLQKHELDHWFAAVILQHCGQHTGKILVGMFLVTAFLSMWMSNASATLMMLPILFSIINRLPQNHHKNTQTYALLGLAYSSSLGGMVTLIGTPANIIIGGQLDIDFFHWLALLGPACAVFFPLMLWVMAWKLKPSLNHLIDVNIVVPKLSLKQHAVLFIFALTCISWMISGYLADSFQIDSMDTWIIMVTGAILVLVNLLEWQDIEKHTQWGILLLSGGGMCLSALLQSSGAGQWLAFNVIDRAVDGDILIFVLVSIIFIIFLTEMMSNAAAAALCMPILVISAQSIHFPPILLAPLVGLTVSMAFMFPISTPPNAIVYGTGKIKLKEMISTGWLLNLLAIVFIFVYLMIL
ncbi:MAG: SLC13 family permease [Legionellales bacterium]|jgi:sodium-dependent dicarboxylate transporter 2/3/5